MTKITINKLANGSDYSMAASIQLVRHSEKTKQMLEQWTKKAVRRENGQA